MQHGLPAWKLYLHSVGSQLYNADQSPVTMVRHMIAGAPVSLIEARICNLRLLDGRHVLWARDSVNAEPALLKSHCALLLQI